MTVINKKLNASYNMLAPEIAADADLKTEIFFPTSEAVSPPVLGNAATVNVQREKTIIDLVTLSADCTLNLKSGENLNIGASDPNDMGVTVFINPDQNILATSRLQVKLRIRPYGYAKYIEVDLGFQTSNE